MGDRISRALRLIKAGAPAAGLVIALAVAGAPGATANSDLFQSLKGRWSGTGAIKFSNGDRERLVCRVTYFTSSGATKLAQTIRCASEGFIIEVKSNFKARGSRVSGSWKETTANISGSISGKSSDTGLRLAIRGTNFTSSMVIRKNGTRQSVSISSKGGRVASVSMNLRKS